ncbi:MAG: glycosyltransferase family 2 protein [Acidobacteriota bacterium]
MKVSVPSVSVVIPAFNQAGYLADAIQSVLAQTYSDYEIIVVDDGSTDETRAVVESQGPGIRYVWQENQGLAGARNTGIREARGRYVALLDSDDAWLPSFLSSMMWLAESRREATVFYCGVIYIDERGCDLPQSGHTRVLPRHELYETLLRYNFLIPSTIVMDRSAIVSAGLFDPAFRRLQDWELWIRLLRQGRTFAGLDECLVRYRIHKRSLSTDPEGGQQAARSLVQKHFGTDDGNPQDWPADKRRAYGGLYRYYALTTSLVRQGNWTECARYLRKALEADPLLAFDLDLFYELALGSEPAGYRNASPGIEVGENAARMMTLLKIVFERPAPLELAGLWRAAHGTAYYALGLVAYSSQLTAGRCRHFVRKAFAYRPDLLGNSQALGLLVRSVPGHSRISRFRSIMGGFRRPSRA